MLVGPLGKCSREKARSRRNYVNCTREWKPIKMQLLDPSILSVANDQQTRTKTNKHPHSCSDTTVLAFSGTYGSGRFVWVRTLNSLWKWHQDKISVEITNRKTKRAAETYFRWTAIRPLRSSLRALYTCLGTCRWRWIRLIAGWWTNLSTSLVLTCKAILSRGLT